MELGLKSILILVILFLGGFVITTLLRFFKPRPPLKPGEKTDYMRRNLFSRKGPGTEFSPDEEGYSEDADFDPGHDGRS